MLLCKLQQTPGPLDCPLHPTITLHCPACRRQVARWSKQYLASVQQPMPSVMQLIAWLQSNVPAEDAAPAAPAVVHGDYRLDNLVLDSQLQVTGAARTTLTTSKSVVCREGPSSTTALAAPC